MSDRHRDWPVRLRIDPSAFVAPGAVVVGDVSLGARSSVWFNTVVRGDSERISIGDDTNIQDNSVVHVDEGLPAIVGHRVTVGHGAIVHGCVIEDDVLIGMGAIVLSGARIGTGSLVGAGALVKEGQVIPPGSLAVGSPAKVVGAVRDAHREAIAVGTKHYAELARTYVERGIGATVWPTTRGAAAYPRLQPHMDFLEWEQRLDVLRTAPALAAAALAGAGAERFRRSGPAGGWSALEVCCHLRDCDREVLAPRIERVLAEVLPAIADVQVSGWAEARRWRDEDPAAAIGLWQEVREAAVRRLEALGPQHWQRPLLHSERGAQTLADVVRYWTDHDLSHRRQWRAALGGAA